MTEDAATNFFNTYNDQSAFNYQCTFNPFEKYAEAIENNERLYERLLESERNKVALLERILQKNEF